MARNYGKLSGKDHYHVSYVDRRIGPGPTFGIANMYGSDFDKYAAHGRIVVEHAVFPQALVVAESILTDIPTDYSKMGTYHELGFHWGGNAYDDYINLMELVHEIRSDALPGDKMRVGQLFGTSVGDGTAWYVITGVARVNAQIEWRGFCRDRYVDRMFGWGGSFRKKDLEIYVLDARGFDAIFTKPKTTIQESLADQRVRLLPDLLDDYRNRYKYVPAEVEQLIQSPLS